MDEQDASNVEGAGSSPVAEANQGQVYPVAWLRGAEAVRSSSLRFLTNQGVV